MLPTHCKTSQVILALNYIQKGKHITTIVLVSMQGTMRNLHSLQPNALLKDSSNSFEGN